MPSEVYTWNEGQIYLWSGTATASALIAFAQNAQALLQYGWENHPSVAGVYAEHLTGQRADLTIQALYTYDAAAIKLILSATALHVKLDHSGINGSAGFLFYSGHVDTLAPGGSEGIPYSYTLAYHAFAWSAYGG